jgi:hypothetical protein
MRDYSLIFFTTETQRLHRDSQRILRLSLCSLCVSVVKILGLLLVFSLSVGAQNARLEALRASEEARKKIEDKLKEDDALNRKRVESMVNNTNKNSAPVTVPLFNTEKELSAREKKLLAVSEAERQKHQAFLQQPDTGLFKLLTIDETRLAIHDINEQQAFPHLVGLGAFFSFAKRTHNADEWAQIRWKDGAFHPAYTEMKRTTVASSGGMAQSFAYTSGYGFAVFTALGNVPLEEVTLQQSAVQGLAALMPATQYQDFINQVRQARAGFRIGGQQYQSVTPVRADTTYVMRAINYKKADVIVAFRVVQQDADGSLHILWKQLKSFSPAELKGKSAKP